MATKEKLKTKAARLREEARETGKVVFRAPALVRFAECVIRFLLGALLAGAEIFGGYAPFGLGLVGASGSGLDGFCALLGACFGYLTKNRMPHRGATDFAEQQSRTLRVQSI